MRTFVVIASCLAIAPAAHADRIDDVLAADAAVHRREAEVKMAGLPSDIAAALESPYTAAQPPRPHIYCESPSDDAPGGHCSLRVAAADDPLGVEATEDDAPRSPAARPPDDEDPPAGRPRPSPTLATNYEHEWRWFGGVGGRFGGAPIDGVDTGTLDQLVLTGGVHRDRVSVLASYGIALLTYPGADQMALDATTTSSTSSTPGMSTEGMEHELEIAGRYAFGHAMSTPTTTDRSQVVGDLFAQIGGGTQIIQWDHGGRLVRPELSFEVGMLGAVRSSEHRRSGWSLALRLEVARRIDVDGAGVTCSAPCTTATAPVAWRDRSVLLETGFVFGN